MQSHLFLDEKLGKMIIDDMILYEQSHNKKYLVETA